MTSTVHEYRYNYGHSRSVLFRMKNVSCKSCGENRITNFLFNNVFPKIVTFMG